jgi:ATP-dependent helicase Lhr and Lhr-like helicase
VTVLDCSVILPEPFARWFAMRGWTPRAHQLELLAKARAGRSVLLIAPTGGGKTLAGFLPSLVEPSAGLSLRPLFRQIRKDEGITSRSPDAALSRPTATPRRSAH